MKIFFYFFFFTLLKKKAVLHNSYKPIYINLTCDKIHFGPPDVSNESDVKMYLKKCTIDVFMPLFFCEVICSISMLDILFFIF